MHVRFAFWAVWRVSRVAHAAKELIAALPSPLSRRRGKKCNVLRGRIDACDYSLDQLLLGTLLFTLLVFLFPTTFVYYLLFFLAYTAIGVVQACLAVVVWVINHFPLFSVANCLWNPSHLPGGIYLQLLATGGGAAMPPDGLKPASSAGLLQAGKPGWYDNIRASGLKHSMSLPDMSATAAAGAPIRMGATHPPKLGAGESGGGKGKSGGFGGPSQPSPLRANERRKASLWGRSSYYLLSNRPLAIPSLFDHYLCCPFPPFRALSPLFDRRMPLQTSPPRRGPSPHAWFSDPSPSEASPTPGPCTPPPDPSRAIS